VIKLGYFRLGDEAVCFWNSDHGDPKIDLHWRTGEPHLLCWRSDYSKRRPVARHHGQIDGALRGRSVPQ
jgi:hypothetical protein